MNSKGKVYLVGAGPGDPGLFTIKGRHVLSQADVVIYDNLCNPHLLREAPPLAKFIYAGKHSGLRTLSQAKIERMMVHFSQLGKRVVRLKGGDPMVFGRGGEEAATLAKHRIPFEIIPGVTSAVAVPAYAGIPVTHREHASGVAIVTAYEDPGKSDSVLDYKTLSRFPGTLLFLMGVKRLRGMTEKLIQFGKPASTPAAIVRWGTRSIQQTLTGKLSDIALKAEKEGVRPPAVVIIGDVVRCRKNLKWFEKKPLFGKRIVVTRTREQASSLTGKIHELGGDVIELPTIEVQPVLSKRIDRALSGIPKWDWIVFTSPWSVRFFFDRFLKVHQDLRKLSGVKFAVIGPSTGWLLSEKGMSIDIEPKLRTSEGLVAELKKVGLWNGKKVLLPKSEIGRDLVEGSLKRWGADVQSLVLYRNIPPKLTWEVEALERLGADIVTFASSSSVKNFAQLLRGSQLSSKIKKELKMCKFVSIGPETSREIRRQGLKVHGEARSSMDGLVEILQKL